MPEEDEKNEQELMRFHAGLVHMREEDWVERELD